MLPGIFLLLALSRVPFLPSGHQKSPDSMYPGFFGTECSMGIDTKPKMEEFSGIADLWGMTAYV
jgi:hypothetical protein